MILCLMGVACYISYSTVKKKNDQKRASMGNMGFPGGNGKARGAGAFGGKSRGGGFGGRRR